MIVLLMKMTPVRFHDLDLVGYDPDVVGHDPTVVGAGEAGQDPGEEAECHR
jgi:hypothetical protein